MSFTSSFKRYIGHILGINALKLAAQENSQRLNELENALIQQKPVRIDASLTHQDIQYVRQSVANNYILGHGIEIGALVTPLPVSSEASVQYVEKYTIDDMKKQAEIAGLKMEDFGVDEHSIVKIDILDDAESLSKIGDNSQNFVIANHVLEHLENPVRAFKNMLRVTKHGGIIYLALPDMRRCFDHRRLPTSIEHVLRDYEEGPAWSRDQAYEEFAVVFVAEGMDKGLFRWCQGDELRKHQQQVADDLKKIDFSIHFHAWTPDTMLEMFLSIKINYKLPFEIKLFLQNHDEAIFIFEKTVPACN